MGKKIKVILKSFFVVVLLASLIGNVYLFINLTETLLFTNANSRDTYFTMHHVKEAHQYATGKEIKVGVLDSFFGLNDNADLYSGAENFTGNKKSLENNRGHGLWMATVLREIAPDCEIYALSIYDSDVNKKAENIVAAIDWAIENNMDILTLSQGALPDEYRPLADGAVNRAIDNNIVTTFIHYDHPDNILPYFGTYYEQYNRNPDIDVFYYDYNPMRVHLVRNYLKSNHMPENGNEMPFFSFSSMSPVTAGFVAVLKEIDNELTPNDYKQILINTSYGAEYIGYTDWDRGHMEKIADIEKAAKYLAAQ